MYSGSALSALRYQAHDGRPLYRRVELICEPPAAAEAALLSFAPPAFALALGSALVWVFRGFR